MNEQLNSHTICQVCKHTIALNSEPVSAGPFCKPTPPDTTKILSYALTALIIYLPANLLPVMSIEMSVQKNKTTTWQGIVSLAESGDWILSMVVFIARMLIPFFKLLVLFYLGMNAKNWNPELRYK